LLAVLLGVVAVDRAIQDPRGIGLGKGDLVAASADLNAERNPATPPTAAAIAMDFCEFMAFLP